jgi:hypothetical protein
MDLGLLLIAPDIAQLQRASRRGRDLRPLAAHTVFDDLLKGNKTGHLPVPGHLYGTLSAPDSTRRRFLPSWLRIITGLAGPAKFIQPPLSKDSPMV